MYTDPGSGLFFVQVLGAAVLTATYRFRRLLIEFFTGRRNGRSKCRN